MGRGTVGANLEEGRELFSIVDDDSSGFRLCRASLDVIHWDTVPCMLVTVELDTRSLVAALMSWLRL